MRFKELLEAVPSVIEPLGKTVHQLHEHFMEGGCYSLAVAHHLRYRWPPVVVGQHHDEDVPDWRTFHAFHVMAQHPTGVLLDIRGPHTAHAVMADWGDCVMLALSYSQLVQIMNPALRALVKKDTPFAEQVIDHYLKPKYPDLYR